MAKNVVKKFAIGTGLAALFGYLAGLLTAPKSGKETRKELKDAAEKGVSEAEQQLKKLHTELDELVNKAKKTSDSLTGKTRKEFDSLVETAKDSKSKVGELINVVRKGGAQDKDLKKAVADASKAVEHLRDYLSK